MFGTHVAPPPSQSASMPFASCGTMALGTQLAFGPHLGRFVRSTPGGPSHTQVDGSSTFPVLLFVALSEALPGSPPPSAPRPLGLGTGVRLPSSSSTAHAKAAADTSEVK